MITSKLTANLGLRYEYTTPWQEKWGRVGYFDFDGTEPVTADEYPALLKAAYGRASIPKPRNLVGIAKDLTVPEMEALLMANQPATEAMAAELAAQRGHAVQSYLAAQKLPAERLFLAAPKTGSQVPKGAPQAELSLATQ